MAIRVLYNFQEISPVPLVSRSYQFLDNGARFGQQELIELSCTLTGLTTPAAAITSLTGKFSDQFKTLQVYEDEGLVYQWDNLVLQEMSFSQSNLPVGGFVPYNVKFLSHQTPSGIVDRSNEYTFTQNEDGTVNVAHKVSAKGVKTSIGALDNAIAFVRLFTGQNPYNSCAPSFIPNGSGVLLGVQESINRAEAVYSVNESYKYTTGSTANYIETVTLDINNSREQDYPSVDLSVKWQGSPVNGSADNLKSSFTSLNLNTFLSRYGINTANVYQNGFNISQNSGGNTIEAKVNYLSGSGIDFSGYFNYEVSVNDDLVTEKQDWSVDGNFVCKGPIAFRRGRIALFKASKQSNSYIPYLKGLITNSALYGAWAPTFSLNGTPKTITIAENTGMATLKLAASFSNDDTYAGLIAPKYSITMDASKWVYELLPAANIEGHYTLQDLQMKSQAKMNINMEAGITGGLSNGINNIKSILTTISGIYMKDGFCISENNSSGIADGVVSYEVLGLDNMGTGMLASKVHGSITNEYLRPKSYLFGY